MTIIAVKDNVMAADGCAIKGAIRYPSAHKKISRAPDGSLVGSCGSSVDCYALQQWVVGGMDFDNPPKFSYPNPDDDNSVDWAWLKLDGSVWRGDSALNVHPVGNGFCIGALIASCFAESAMALGLDAAAAVEHAITHCEQIGGPVQVERLRPIPPSGAFDVIG